MEAMVKPTYQTHIGNVGWLPEKAVNVPSLKSSAFTSLGLASIET
eukprot:IDg18128t1